MNATRRPVSVWIVSCLYIAVGTIGFAYYFPELMAHHDQSVLIELTELLAIVSGAFMVRGRNWARSTRPPHPPPRQSHARDRLPAHLADVRRRGSCSVPQTRRPVPTHLSRLRRS